MKFKTPQDAIRFLGNFGLQAEFPVNGGVFMAINPHTKEKFEVIGNRIFVSSAEKVRFLDQDTELMKELEDALAD